MTEGCKYCVHHAGGAVPEGMRWLGRLQGMDLFLLEDARHPGRCVLAPVWHQRDLFQLAATQRADLIEASSTLARLLADACRADKVNLGFYGDRADHLHAHLVPKWEGGAAWGDGFALNPEPGLPLGPGPFAGQSWAEVAVHLQTRLAAAS